MERDLEVAPGLPDRDAGVMNRGGPVEEFTELDEQTFPHDESGELTASNIQYGRVGDGRQWAKWASEMIGR